MVSYFSFEDPENRRHSTRRPGGRRRATNKKNRNLDILLEWGFGVPHGVMLSLGTLPVGVDRGSRVLVRVHVHDHVRVLSFGDSPRED